MSAISIRPTHWPDLPPLPRPGEPVLVRIDTAGLRPEGQRQVRTAARAILAAWSGRAADDLPWRETARGPLCEPAPDVMPVSLSFSYDGEAGWIGLVRGGTIGIDAMKVAPFPEMAPVAELYLGPLASQAIAADAAPARRFAQIWTEMEARLKFLRRDLTEWPGNQIPEAAHATGRRVHDNGDTVVTVVISPTASSATMTSLP